MFRGTWVKPMRSKSKQKTAALILLIAIVGPVATAIMSITGALLAWFILQAIEVVGIYAFSQAFTMKFVALGALILPVSVTN